MAAIVASVGTGTGEIANYPVPVPAGTVDGDLLIGVHASEWDTIADNALPAGFTPLGTSTFDGGGNQVHVALGYRIASSEPASYTFNPGSGSTAAGAIIRVTGHDTTPVIVEVAPVAFSSEATATAPSLIPSGADDLLLCFFGAETSGSTCSWTPPTGMTELADLQSTAYCTLHIASLQSPSNPSGTKHATPTNLDHGGACTISIKSAGGAPAPASGSATGSLSLTGSATGSARHAGTASGSLTLTGSATGSAPAVGTASGSASGILPLSGSASGSAQHRGSGSGNLDLTGSAAGSTAHTGNGAGGLGLSGAASGSTVHRGSADGVLPISGSATGTSPTVGGARGSATGTLHLTGSATGSTPHTGSGSGTLPLAGSAAGSTRYAGTATGALDLTGTATGRAPALVVRDIRVIEVTAPRLAATTTSPGAGVLAAFEPSVAASTTGPGTALVAEEPNRLTPWTPTEAALTATTTQPDTGWDLTEPER